MTAEEASGAKLSPRKQRQMADSFFGPKGVARDLAAREHPTNITNTPSASGSTAALLSSSPAFATPLHPVRPFVANIHGAAAKAATATTAATTSAATSKPTILPILLPPATLRPLAFRTFTKKHSLTLTSSALQELATFVGRHCGSGWREEGLAERVLEETAKSWKNRNCGFIVDGASPELKDILKTLEGNMSGGRIVAAGGRGRGGGAARRAETAATLSSSTTIASTTSTTSTATTAGAQPGLARQDSLLLDAAHEADFANTRLGLRPALSRAGTGMLSREDSQTSSGMGGGLEGDDADGLDEDDEDSSLSDPRRWLQVVSAYDQPRMLYNVTKKHFERDTSKPSLLPNTTHKTAVFRNRFHVVHQRLLRNESFQSSAVAEARAVSTLAGGRRQQHESYQPQQTHKITPVANLLGRHGTHHMLLGMLVVLPTGSLSICDLSASIALDLSSAVAIPEDSAWFAPGMIVLVDGVYEEEEEAAGRGLNGATGVGGTIGGRFQAFFIGQPPCEKRKVALGISGPDGGADHAIGGGFGWIDFLGVGSQRAVGAKMRKLEQRLLYRQRQRQRIARLRESDAMHESQEGGGREATTAMAAAPADAPAPGRHRVVILGELHLDQPRTLQALKKILALYAAEPEGSTPVAFVLTGNFTEHAVMARSGGSGGSIEYKEYFDALASALAEYPTLLQQATFVFVPGDNDGWVSAFAGGAAVPLPRKPVPDLFTSRVRRAFAAANAERPAAAASKGGEAVWTTNPSRLTLFGPNHEMVLFRDDMSGRLRRTAVRLRGGLGVGDPMEVEEADEAPSSSSRKEADRTDKNGGSGSGSGSGSGPAGLSHDIRAARKLVKTILDQGYLAPFRTSLRPVHWDFAGALHLYPLPTALVLVDTTAPAFCVTYEGCHVMNPGSLLVPGRRGAARWIEYELGRTGRARECTF